MINTHGIKTFLKTRGKWVFSIARQWSLTIVGSNHAFGRGVFISHDSKLSSHNFINDFSRVIDSSLGHHTYVSPFTLIVGTSIGNYCSVGPGSQIGLGMHPLNLGSTSPYLYNPQLFQRRRKEDFARVTIGHDVWIGSGVSILGGVKIGTGAVIGAGAIVTKDVPPYAVVVGVPARIVKYRFEFNVQAQLLASNWWKESPNKARCILDVLAPGEKV